MKDKDLLRYSRHIMLPEIDIEGQRKISSAKVAIIGLGGLGCSASIFLTSSGVGELCLVDDDVIDLSNLQRQILFSESDVHKGKILAAKESLSSLNKDIKLIAQNLKITASNIFKFCEVCIVIFLTIIISPKLYWHRRKWLFNN